MRVVQLEIENFRGIEKCRWNPSPEINCLIGPGDSTKTTILDAIELALSPRSNFVFDDADVHNLDPNKAISITVTLAGLPTEFADESRYGLHLRGWDEPSRTVHDEPGEFEPAISVRVASDEALEARWSIFNDRVAAAVDQDPPAFRTKDARVAAPVRLGPYADRHLGWGRQSVLARLNANKENVGGQLVKAARAARDAFRGLSDKPFGEVVGKVQKLAATFSVPVKKEYIASLDLQNFSLSTGGISLHDGHLPLRRLGTGSSRLLVAAIQRGAGADAPIAIIDEIEHGLEPHRLARLLQYLKEPGPGVGVMQSFITTHSVVTVREVKAEDLFCTSSRDGVTTVTPAASTARSPSEAQRHIRGNPEAFLAKRVIIGEGRTEQGICRGLDAFWSAAGSNSFALKGAIAVDGGGSSATALAEHLQGLGHKVFVLLDSDRTNDEEVISRIRKAGGAVHEWEGKCCIEMRLFSDLPWAAVSALVKLAVELRGSEEAILSSINKQIAELGRPTLTSTNLASVADSPEIREVLAKASIYKTKQRDHSWFKSVSGGEEIAAVIAPALDQIKGKPLNDGIVALRGWIDGE